MKQIPDFLSVVPSSDTLPFKPTANIPSKYSDTFPPLYGKMKSRKPYGRSFLSDIDDIRKSLQHIIFAQDEIQKSLLFVAGGSGGMSEELANKVHSIDIRLTRTETLVEQISIKLDKLDSKIDGMANVIATKDFVEKVVGKSEISTMKWIIGTGVGVAALVIGIIKLF